MIHKISKDEVEIFRQAVQDVKPLKKITSPKKEKPLPRKAIIQPDDLLKTPRTKKEKLPTTVEWSVSTFALDGDLTGNSSVEFLRSGVQQRTLAKLKTGKIEATATLDLHGFTLSAAEKQLKKFLSHALENKKRVVKIIHGKGSTNRAGEFSAYPKLKNAVVIWLKEVPQVLGFCSAPKNEGGTGALYILLKQI